MATVRAQADALQATLRERGVDATLFIAMRYWRPFAEEAVAQMTAQNVTRLVSARARPSLPKSRAGPWPLPQALTQALPQALPADPSRPGVRR